MNAEISSNQIIQDLANLGIRTYSAIPNKVDIILEHKDLNEFKSLLKDFEVKVIFFEVTILEENEIEENIITNFDVMGTFRKELLKEEIETHNKKIEKMRQFIGKEQDMRLFFTHQGIIYSLMIFHDDLYVEAKEDVLSEMFEKYEEELNESEEKARIESQRQQQNYFEKIRDYLMNSEAFLKCKNKDLRRAFIFNSIREAKELKDIEAPTTLAADIVEVVEDVWRTLKRA